MGENIRTRIYFYMGATLVRCCSHSFRVEIHCRKSSYHKKFSVCPELNYIQMLSKVECLFRWWLGRTATKQEKKYQYFRSSTMRVEHHHPSIHDGDHDMGYYVDPSQREHLQCDLAEEATCSNRHNIRQNFVSSWTALEAFYCEALPAFKKNYYCSLWCWLSTPSTRPPSPIIEVDW